MRVKALVEHFNDYPLSGPAVAVGADRLKSKGTEYEIADDEAAKRLIADGTVEKVAEKDAAKK
jgi:hypothetical protein